MNRAIMSEILEYKIPERILLVEDIWDSIAEVPDTIELTEEQRNELDHRLKKYHTHPSEGTPWDIVKKRL